VATSSALLSMPRVTQVLQACGLGPDLSAIAPAVLERALKRGSFVHQAIEDDAYGLLDEAALSDEVRAYLASYRAFLVDTGHRPIVSEVEVRHPVWHYAGKLDRVGWQGPARVLVDWKTGWDPDLFAAAIQTAAYEAAWEAQHPTEPISRRLVVRLTPEGYRIYDMEELGEDYPGASEAWLIFQAAMVLYRARERKGNGR
jgi:hypothetical protein